MERRLFTEWFEPHPTRVIPCAITYLGDREQAVAEIYRNAERGFVSVTLPDRPHLIGLPSLWEHDFWFCTLDDPSTIGCRHTIGVDNIMLETDYPHGDGTWPHTQDVIERHWGHIPHDELRAMCCENAARLYRHPLPEVVLPQ